MSNRSEISRTQTSPLAKLLAVWNLDQRNLVLRAERNHELLVRLLFACLVQDAHVCLAAVESLGGFAETTCETIVDESEFEDTFQSLEHAHLALASRCIGRYLDLGGRADLGFAIVFSVRLLQES